MIGKLQKRSKRLRGRRTNPRVSGHPTKQLGKSSLQKLSDRRQSRHTLYDAVEQKNKRRQADKNHRRFIEENQQQLHEAKIRVALRQIAKA